MNIQAAQSNNSVQQFSALNAFKNNKNVAKPEQEEVQIDSPSGTKTSNAAILLEEIDIDDIRECARSVGEYNLTEDDIKYGMLYGRSVIAEWLC
ncbi:hypothetical protein IKQ21_02585 [bacterium]|nr:hypothetical protein [bacterium]